MDSGILTEPSALVATDDLGKDQINSKNINQSESETQTPVSQEG